MNEDTKNNKYMPDKIEEKWQEKWAKEGIYEVDVEKSQNPFFNLMMFPYPSAEGLHVGNMYAFTGSDIIGRFHRMHGKDVLEPIGLDGFGIHSENYALKVGRTPQEHARISEENFYRQLHMIGNGFAWNRKVETYDPDYYKWTQWLFIQLFKKGLAYRKKAPVNYCPKDKTVLADEQVIDGKCERCGSEVEKRNLEQWFFKITEYADRLLENIKDLDWSEKVKIAQKNWIGKKTGIEITYDIENSHEKVVVFTTRPDTNFGATFIALAPEHPLVAKITTPENKEKVEEYVKMSQHKTEQERTEEGKEKTGVFTGAYAINQLNGYKMPIWVSDFVLIGFGTGALVGVPGHDKRDFFFAKEFGLEIKRVVEGENGDMSEIAEEQQVQEETGKMVNSGFLDGMDVHEATQKIMDYMEEKGYGKRRSEYHLRDWLISRQRYWGPPIPMIYCEKCDWQPVPEDQLPVLLPETDNWKPTGTDESPLAAMHDWIKTTCPNCKGPARRETDVSDTFLDSSWYFFRYTSTDVKDAPFDKDRVKKWLPVALYTGGAEHSVLHLLYARFVTMVLKDAGFIDFEEPFARFRAHGLIIKDGAKMSKSKGNVINPDEYIKKFGADTLRTYLMFVGAFSQGGDFRDSGIEGMYRFLKRIWTLVHEGFESGKMSDEKEGQFAYMMHRTIKRVTEDIEMLHYNTAISAVMEYYNAIVEDPTKTPTKDELKTMVLLLAPFAPHMTEELWQTYFASAGDFASIHKHEWPTFDESKLEKDSVTVVVQVNGKMRGSLTVATSEMQNKDVIESRAKESENVTTHLAGKTVKQVVYVPGKILNFVTD